MARTCSACNGTGEIRKSGRLTPCIICKSKGTRRGKPNELDPMFAGTRKRGIFVK